MNSFLNLLRKKMGIYTEHPWWLYQDFLCYRELIGTVGLRGPWSWAFLLYNKSHDWLGTKHMCRGCWTKEIIDCWALGPSWDLWLPPSSTQDLLNNPAGQLISILIPGVQKAGTFYSVFLITAKKSPSLKAPSLQILMRHKHQKMVWFYRAKNGLYIL